MYKKILVGLDGSSHGLKAAEAAVEIAKKFDAELHLLTVTRPYKVSPKLKQYLEAENLLGEPKYVMDQMTNAIVIEAMAIAEKAGLKKVESQVREGKPARTIVDHAHNNKIDLIVLGSRGIGEVEGALLGSVSQKVSLLSGCAVMIVR
jgi:nucleotide-binding universal stress UspA family protein